MVTKCELPPTAKPVVDVLIADLAVFHFSERRMTLVELMPGGSEDQAATATHARYDVDPEG